MRLDEFATENGLTMIPMDQFDGFTVRVSLPTGWEPYRSAPGTRIWICLTEPENIRFRADAVLTMHSLESPTSADEVFAMLADQQLHSVPDCHEIHREFPVPTEGIGIAGVLAVQVDHDLGIIDSIARSEIVTLESATLITELTVTALHDSPVDRSALTHSVQPHHDSNASRSPHSAAPTEI